MSGVVGCFKESETADRPSAALGPLLGRLRHRGPDGTGFHQGKKGALGSVRLDASDGRGEIQPLASKEGGRWIVADGAFSSAQEFRPGRGDPSSDAGPLATLLRLYEEQGRLCVDQLDGVYAFAVLNERDLFLARDPLGIKPLYFCRHEGWLYFASEIKALTPISERVQEFPPGHWYHSRQGLHRFFELKDWVASAETPADPLEEIRRVLGESVRRRVPSAFPAGVFLSGGLDSSLIAALMRPHVETLHSFSVGMAGSEDLFYARQVSEHIRSTHHERVITEEEMRAVLPKVIYHLESFDFALVRSAIANYLVADLARQHVRAVLIGEGSDELFAGYHYLKEMPEPARAGELLRLTTAMHNTCLQRVDRMTAAHGLDVRVPFLDLNLLRIAHALPLDLRQKNGVEKWALRQAFAPLLPSEVIWRPKEKFSRGAGSSHVFERIAEREISDDEFARGRRLSNGIALRSKEEMFYYRIFHRFYPDPVAACLGWTAQPQAR